MSGGAVMGGTTVVHMLADNCAHGSNSRLGDVSI